MYMQMMEGTARPVSRMKQIGLVLVGICAIALGAKIQVPFWPVPMTLQTLAIFLVASGFGLRLGLTTILGYLAAGLAGLPVFAGSVAGPLYFAGPTAGFLLGFVALVALVGFAGERGFTKGPVSRFAVFVGADTVCFLMGFAWLAYGFVLPSTGNAMGTSAALSAGVLPFVLGDVLKAALAAMGISGASEILTRLVANKHG